MAKTPNLKSLRISFSNNLTQGSLLALTFIFFISFVQLYRVNTFQSKVSHGITNSINLFENGDTDKAIKDLENIIKKDPNNNSAKTNLAQFYFKAKDYDKFISFVTDNNLESGSIFNMMAVTYQGKGDNDSAETYYKKAIKISPNNSKLYISYAAFFQQQQNYSKALEVINQGLTLNPKSTTLLISAASFNLKSGNKTEARNYANQALKIDPSNTQAKAILKEV